jgi:hypothetical protein
MRDTPFYGLAVERQQQSIQQQHRRIRRDTKRIGDCRRCTRNRNALLGLTQQDAVLLREGNSTVLDDLFL